MKKIIALCAIALMGFSASAATAAWYAEDIYEYGGTGNLATDYLLYFFDADVVSTASATTSLAAGDFSFLTKGYVSDYMEDGEGAVNAGTYGNSVDVTGYFVVFNSDSTETATYAYVSATDVATTGGAGQAAAFDLLGTSSAIADNWTAVPEPTSGLLLVVGGALLALRRRRLA